MEDTKQAYQPGVCNIGKAEIERRRRVGLAGILAALGLVVVMGALGVYDLFKLIVFIPAFIGAVGSLQAYYKFCAAYGLISVFNLDDAEFKTKPVIEQKAIEADKGKAYEILYKSLGIAFIFTILALLWT